MLAIKTIVSDYDRGAIGSLEVINRLRSLLANQPKYRHVKTGGSYYVQNDNAMLQWPNKAYDHHSMTIYYSDHGDREYVRLTDEFMDGRFTRV